MTTRPAIQPRSEGVFTSLDSVLLQMITANVGKPCPDVREIREWTGMPRRRVWPYLYGLRDRGHIEIEERGGDEHGRGIMRRMRLTGGPWTCWTARRPMASPQSSLPRSRSARAPA